MKKNIIILIMFSILLAVNLQAVFNDYEPSPRSRALGGAFYSTSNDANAIFYNPAGLIYAGNNFLVGYTRLFGNNFQELTSVAVSTQLPGNYGHIALGIQAMEVDYRDVNLLSEKTYAISHAMNLMKDIHSELNLGYSLNLYHLSINGFGDEVTLGVNIGLLAILHQRTRIGITVTNINNPKLGEENSEDLPQKLAMGVSYEPYDGVTTSLELKKAFDSDTEIHSGVEIKLLDMLSLRFGLRNNPNQYSMGANFSMYNIIVDYAYATHAVLNDTHHIGVGYRF